MGFFKDVVNKAGDFAKDVYGTSLQITGTIQMATGGIVAPIAQTVGIDPELTKSWGKLTYDLGTSLKESKSNNQPDDKIIVRVPGDGTDIYKIEAPVIKEQVGNKPAGFIGNERLYLYVTGAILVSLVILIIAYILIKNKNTKKT